MGLFDSINLRRDFNGFECNVMLAALNVRRQMEDGSDAAKASQLYSKLQKGKKFSTSDVRFLVKSLNLLNLSLPLMKTMGAFDDSIADEDTVRRSAAKAKDIADRLESRYL